MPYKVQKYAKCSFFFLIGIMLTACNQHKEVDVSDIKVDLEIERFDKDLAAIQPNEVEEKLPALQKKYGVFYKDYFEKILNAGDTKDGNFGETVSAIIGGKPYQDLQQETDSVFKTFDREKAQLTDAFKHIKYYYPKEKIPKIITYISGFQVQTPIGENYIGVGLDMFLGKNSKFYPALVESVPMYISRRFTPENITPRVVEVLAREDMFPERNEDKTLLAKMVYEGKLMYFIKKTQPALADSTIIGYTASQMEWAHNFESDIWAYFLSEDLLYNSDYLKIQKYLSEAPFTPGLGSNNNSAPKLGIFTGWQIVNRYMENETQVTLQQLMAEEDAQKVLRLSKYRPENSKK